MLRRIFRWLLASLAVLVVLIVALVLILRPPAPLTAERGDVVLSGVTIINPGAGRVANQRIQIRGSTIESISNDGEPRPSSQAHVSRNAYVLPGLIDMHVHHPPGRAIADTQLFALLHLAHGTTAVRDTGNFDGSILGTRDAVRNGELAGPRIFACGPIIDGDPPVWPGSIVATDAASGERAAEQIAAQGFDCIKVYQNLNADALAGARRAAVRRGLPLIGHVPSAVPFNDARLDDIQHLTGIASEPPRQDAAPADLIEGILRSWEHIDEELVRSMVRFSAEQKLAHTPTITVIDQLSRLNDYALLSSQPEARLLPRYYREIFWRPAGFSAAQYERWPDGQTIRTNFRNVVRQLHDAGVTVHAGTDVLNPFVIPGTAMQTELRNLTESGFTLEQAWEAATRGNGASLPIDGLGRIAAGAPADLLVFRDDPTRDFAALATLEAVVADGRFYSKPALEEAIARHRRKFEGWLYDRILMLLVETTARPMTNLRESGDEVGS